MIVASLIVSPCGLLLDCCGSLWLVVPGSFHVLVTTRSEVSRLGPAGSMP